MDKARIFWLAIFFLFTLILSFLFGYLIGKSYNYWQDKPKQEETETEFLLKPYPKKANEDFELYKVLEVPSSNDSEQNGNSKEKENKNLNNNNAAEKIYEEENKKPNSGEEKISKKFLTENPENDYRSLDKIFTIQVGSFVELKNAERLKMELIKTGFKPYIKKAKINNRTFYRVMLGHFNSPTEGLKLLHKLKSINDEFKSSFMTTID